MSGSYRFLLLRINIALIHLAFSMSGASAPMTGVITFLLAAMIRIICRQLDFSNQRGLIRWKRGTPSHRSCADDFESGVR
jgi:hypothetical protein